MCGICVMASEGGRPVFQTVPAMCDRLVHRGPDSEGIETDGRVGLGMRRLSIIDLERRRANRSSTRTARLAVVLNGEIYNYRELQARAGQERAPLRHRLRHRGDRPPIRRPGRAGRRAAPRDVCPRSARPAQRGATSWHGIALASSRCYYAAGHGATSTRASELKSLLAIPGFRPDARRSRGRPFSHSCTSRPHEPSSAR